MEKEESNKKNLTIVGLMFAHFVSTVLFLNYFTSPQTRIPVAFGIIVADCIIVMLAKSKPLFSNLSKKKLLSIALILIMLMSPLLSPMVEATPAAPYLVTPSPSLFAAGGTTQKQTFTALGRIWCIVGTSSARPYKFSLFSTSKNHPGTWIETYIDEQWLTDFERAGWLEEPNILHVVWETTTPTHGDNYAIDYVRLTLNKNGTATVGPSDTAYGGDFSAEPTIPSITQDSTGRLWCVFNRYDGNSWHPWVTMSTTHDGTWTVGAGFPYELSSTSAAGGDNFRNGVYALLSGEVYVTYVQNGGKLYGKRYNGAWGAAETISSANLYDAAHHDEASSIGIVYFAYALANTSDMFRIRNADGSFGTEKFMYDSDYAGEKPFIAAVKGFDYCIYSYSNLSRHIWYRDRINGVWGTAVDWITNAADPQYLNLHSYSASNEQNNLGIIYLSHAATPHNVRYYNRKIISARYPNYFNITNAELGSNIIKADYIFYHCIATYDIVGTDAFDTIQFRFNTSAGTEWGWYKPNSKTEKFDCSDNIAIKNNVWSNTTTLGTWTFDMFFESTVHDTHTIAWEGNFNTTAASSGWYVFDSLDYDLITFGGLTYYTSTGTAGQIVGGDWINIYANKASSERVDYVKPNILVAQMELPLGLGEGMTTTQRQTKDYFKSLGSWYFGMDYTTTTSTDWVNGWYVKITPWNSTYDVSPPSFLFVEFKADWYNRGALVKTDHFTSSYEGFTESNTYSTLYIDLWFNQAEGSTKIGGLVGPKYFGVQSQQFLWFFDTNWNPITTIDGSVGAQSFFFDNLKNEDNTIMSVRSILTTRLWAKVERANTGSAAYPMKIYPVGTYVDITVGGQMDSSHTSGVPTPRIPDPQMPALVGGGIFGWIIGAISALFLGLGKILLTGIDGILAMIFHVDGIMSNVVYFLSSGIGYIFLLFKNTIGFAFDTLTLTFGSVLGLITATISLIAGTVSPLFGFAIWIWNWVTSVLQIMYCFIFAQKYYAPWGGVYDMTGLGVWNNPSISVLNGFSVPIAFGLIIYPIAALLQSLFIAFGGELQTTNWKWTLVGFPFLLMLWIGSFLWFIGKIFIGFINMVWSIIHALKP